MTIGPMSGFAPDNLRCAPLSYEGPRVPIRDGFRYPRYPTLSNAPPTQSMCCDFSFRLQVTSPFDGCVCRSERNKKARFSGEMSESKCTYTARFCFTTQPTEKCGKSGTFIWGKKRETTAGPPRTSADDLVYFGPAKNLRKRLAGMVIFERISQYSEPK